MKIFLFILFIFSSLGICGTLPDSKLTPGAVDPAATVEKLDDPKFIKEARNVTIATKKEVFDRYGIDWEQRQDYEVDHRLPLCCGGKNSIENLWCQPWHIEWNGCDVGAHTKDALEVKIHHMIKNGKLSLADGQAVFLGDWIQGYLKYVGKLPEYKNQDDTNLTEK